MKRILLVCLLMSILILAGCGGGGGGDDDGVTLNYIPNFSFSSTTSAALTYGSSDFNEEQRQKYIMLSPFLIGFNKSPQTITNGKLYSYALQNSSSNLGLTASVSGSIVTFTGSVPNNSGNITIVINTANNTFSYEQLLRVQADSAFVVIYIKLTDVEIKDNGYYQTKGTAYVLSNQYSFLGQMQYYFGKGQAGHAYSNDTHVVIGTYGTQLAPTSTLTVDQSVLETISSSAVVGYFSDTTSWTTGDPMILYYDKTDGQFYTTGTANQAYTPVRELDVDGLLYPKQPWTLL